ncbi:MAG: hypothetical protein A3C58_03815 [Candidatus Staskawiczbacteria bacterium RIFCSPHIGHO2_02_FULL_34_10]|uniref:Type 4 fimbrial biogenesis protein PilX N-terminal domain-containing protein n=1 Tax=Candidatus Staskawiczbacteria bacterium RIFCSPHIGHO2_02_FULL_34_10 TaxID=1802205 RepID=A0A1G2HY98_9BACT|nr:MAG: hypothetical protein A3C58_03815 [Candidatus Staskawiczbacteria bacterium RIFCSPHIGHO2_02_FULL_34_10]
MKILNLKSKILYRKEEGFVVSIVTFFVLIIMLSITISISSLITYRQKIYTNVVKSTQSYYTAESGIEDSLLRLNNNPQMSALSYSLSVNGTTASVVIPSIIGGSRTIVSEGTSGNVIKDIQTVYSIDSTGASFHYGAQIGAGGLQMSNSSRIIGSVFSNGSITASGSATIDNDVIIAGNGNSLSGMHVKGNALVYSCINSVIDGNLTYVNGGTNNCTVGGTTFTQPGEIISQPLPISQSQIDEWKSDAEDGGTTGSVSLSGSQTMSLGPKKITGDLSISNSAVLTLTGTVYVTGNINISNSGRIKLDSSYGSLSGVILANGTISPGNSSVLQGSGQAGSYLLVLSTSTSNSAINIGNSASGAIFYTTAGGIKASNSFSAREVTGYKLIMSNSATITYESGLADVLFTSGPGGSWKVTSWGEK